MYGYNGKVALVDLTSRAVRVINYEEEFARKFIGGSGMGSYFLLKYCTPKTEALSPENPLIYMVGPYQGTGIPTSGRHQVVTRSPLTGVFLESDAGGTFGFHLKRAGFDGVIIIGKSKEPVYVSIFNGSISFNDANPLWGLDTVETEAFLKNLYGKTIGVSCIGPAGENMVPLAGIFHDGPDARAAGRGGAGAVMGSKKLKALVVGGEKTVEVFDRDKLIATIKEKASILKDRGYGLSLYGTAGGTALAEELGDLPVKNWSLGSFKEKVSSITGQHMAETILAGNYGCMACPIRCGRVVNLNGDICGGPEYETVAMLGSNCMVDDLNVIAEANALCNRYGLDTISTGSVIAFAMELYERGILKDFDLQGTLNWGDGQALLRLIRMIAFKEGIGEVLGQGARKASEKIGKGSEHFAIHVKGLELPAHDPRCFKSLASGYATSVRGACHLNSYSYPWERSAVFPELGYPQTVDRKADKGKGIMTAKFQNLCSVLDSLKICKFAVLLGVDISTMCEWLEYVTSFRLSKDDFLEAGERIYTMKKVFNVGVGMTRKDDILPERILKEPRDSGGSEGLLPDLESQLEEYYNFRGWGENGIPNIEVLKKLKVEEFAHWLPV
ncbi:aldehyde ferredoxin oxidoreductase family protein [Thermovirga sp.]|uniref:aldehyde ferredoxin oxidoreductase family protein n=1 Tax=Thermovirga sp. TaxID=2699834 RepID=UPI0025DD1CAB|nr:aldehyde ferredoxin oxidoreductase family protein [Thermovirga sp.]MBO8153953.1 aldehyde ferredoxin oxidoreductase family protein [Thermovirga sp.]